MLRQRPCRLRTRRWRTASKTLGGDHSLEASARPETRLQEGRPWCETHLGITFQIEGDRLRVSVKDSTSEELMTSAHEMRDVEAECDVVWQSGRQRSLRARRTVSPASSLCGALLARALGGRREGQAGRGQGRTRRLCVHAPVQACAHLDSRALVRNRLYSPTQCACIWTAAHGASRFCAKDGQFVRWFADGVTDNDTRCLDQVMGPHRVIGLEGRVARDESMLNMRNSAWA